MSANLDRVALAASFYRAFAAADRETAEALLAPGFRFHSPPDPELDRDGWFERCWPHAGNGTAFEIVRAVESGDELIVTYEAIRPSGARFRNTEVLRFDGERLVEAEVYFGWELDQV